MSFDRPWWMLALVAIPALLAAYVALGRRSSRYAVAFPNLAVLAQAVPGARPWRRHLAAALALLSLAAAGVAVAGPHVTWVAPIERATVVMVIDTSRSMQSTDVRPSRLAAAQQAARRFVGLVPERLRLALVLFAGEVVVASPPTLDRDRVRSSIGGIGSFSGFGGTAIGDAISRAVEVGRDAVVDDPERTPSSRAGPLPPDAQGAVSILFLSDGRQNRGLLPPLEGARLAKEAGIPVHTVALGTITGDSQGFGSFNRAPDPDTLRAIAEATGGEFFHAVSRGALVSAYADLGSKLGRAPRRTEVTFAFAAAAALLLVAFGTVSAHWAPRLP
jgi:Ca-activated chloride channel family protein